jgi:hypothetical protein
MSNPSGSVLQPQGIVYISLASAFRYLSVLGPSFEYLEDCSTLL